MMAQDSLERNTSPARVVTSLGIYSNAQLDDQLKGLYNSAKSIKQFMINGQYYPHPHKEDQCYYKCKQHDVNNEECEGQPKKKPSICRIKMGMNKCMEEGSNQEDSVLRSSADSLDLQSPYRQSLSPRHRDYQVVANKYKSNIQYLQTQLKQIYNIHVYQSIVEETRETKADISRLEAQLRKLRLEINQIKNVKAKVQSNHTRIEELRYLIANQKKLLNKLNIRELELEDCLGRDKKQYPEIYEQASLEDIEDISNLHKKDSKLQTKRLSTGKNLTNNKCKKQNIKQTDISDCNTSYYVKMRDSIAPSATDISDIINNSAFMLRNVNYEPETYPFEKQQECTSETLKDNRNEQEHKNILKERIKILKQSIVSRSEDFIRRIELLKKEKVCLKRIVQIIKINSINIEAEKRSLKKVILRQKSQTIFKSRLLYGQRMTPNKSDRNSLFAFREQQNSRQDSISNEMRNIIYEDASRQYQIRKNGPANNGNSRSEEKEKDKKMKFCGSHKKLRYLNTCSTKEKGIDTKFHEEYYMVGLTQ